jgi:GT2 family glycosyltransferase
MPEAIDVRAKVRVAIVTYNSARHIASCLQSIVCQAADLDIVLVDNGSSDDTCQIVRSRFSHVRLITLADNVGFARGVNLAASEPAAGEYILLLNPDAVLAPDAVDALLRMARADPSAQIYGGKMLKTSGEVNLTSCHAAPSLLQAAAFAFCIDAKGLTHLDPDSLGGWSRSGTRHVPALSGGFLLVTAELWRSLKGLDEAFFLYGEDVDFCLRARPHGARPLFVDQAVCIHDGGASSRSRSDFLVSLLAGTIELYQRHLPPMAVPLARRFMILGALLRALGEGGVRPGQNSWRETWRRRWEWRGGWTGTRAS